MDLAVYNRAPCRWASKEGKREVSAKGQEKSEPQAAPAKGDRIGQAHRTLRNGLAFGQPIAR